MASAPGGKALDLAIQMDNEGEMFCCEISKNRSSTLRKLLKKTGVSVAEVLNIDSSTLRIAAEGEKVEKEGENGIFKKPFDKILLDAPCSDTGIRGRFYSEESASTMHCYPAVQKKLIFSAVPLLKEGGNMVYSTCSLSPLENEQVVRWTLDNFPAMKLVEQSPFLGENPCVSKWLEESERLKIQKFVPSEKQNFSGFFIAKFQKTKL